MTYEFPVPLVGSIVSAYALSDLAGSPPTASAPWLFLAFLVITVPAWMALAFFLFERDTALGRLLVGAPGRELDTEHPTYLLESTLRK